MHSITFSFPGGPVTATYLKGLSQQLLVFHMVLFAAGVCIFNKVLQHNSVFLGLVSWMFAGDLIFPIGLDIVVDCFV